MKAEKLRKLIEGKTLYLATASAKGKPNLVCVEGNLVEGNSVVFTNNCFGKTQKNLKENKLVSLVATDNKKWIRFNGKAEIYASGKWFSFVCGLKANKGFKPKSAIVVKVEEITDLDSGKLLDFARRQHLQSAKREQK